MKQNSVGIKDIAKHAGVSTGPVDKVLNNRGGVSEATKKKILKAIEELGYTPNILASRLKSAKTYNIAVLFPKGSDDNPFWYEHEKGFNDSMKELESFGFNIHLHLFHQNYEESFVSQTNMILQKNYDGVFMVPVYKNETLRFTEYLEKKGVPVVLFDTQLSDLMRIPFIGQNAKDSGYLAADLMNKCLPNEESILIASITERHDNYAHFDLREQGFKDFFKNSTSRLLEYKSIDQKDEVIKEQLSEFLKIHPNIKGVFVTNGIHKIAPLFSNIDNHILIGYDLIDKNIAYLKEGYIDFLISQRPYTQAHSGIRLFYDLLIKKSPIKNTNNYLPIDIVMKSNIDYYTDFVEK
ncbi:LacI family DNA-binding transcriptional regulator [uncultured Algibacter sp.]|uniref:LacI family DNA-binding transcriptional regulator n=1 Tax=uncultured Algibacter sp. TaxID=298659 RepID=UPI002627489E|nr:LacI family DNA-binding transcriptional regulator [uncultured Algibacter sp.]